jgi:phosphosulfolactate synthase
MYQLNFPLAGLPERTVPPRKVGITMVMDKGLGRRAAEDLVENAAPYFDYLKLGWSTALLARSLTDKLALYRSAGIKPYFGGTLWEAFYVRKQVEDFLRFLDKHQMEVVEISDGSIDQPHEEKLYWIRFFSERGYEVLSEVGSKDATKVLPPFRWIELIKAELGGGVSVRDS